MPRTASKLTKPALDRLRARAESDPSLNTMVADGGAVGLYARARAGAVVFVLRYRPGGRGARQTLTLGKYGSQLTLDAARRAALDHQAAIARGVDPIATRAEARRDAVTVGEAVDAYLADFEDRAMTRRTARGKASTLRTFRGLLSRVVERIGAKRLRDLTPADVQRVHRSIGAESPTSANRALVAFSAVFGYAERTGLLPVGAPNPCRRVERNREAGERRALTSDELRRLGEALRQCERNGTVNPAAILGLRLMSLTGFRRGEVFGTQADPSGGLRWRDVDFDSGVVTLADTKTGRQRRQVGSAAIELLRAARPADAKPEDKVAPLTWLDKARRRVWKLADLPDRTPGEPLLDLHSLRHTFASVGAHVQTGRFVGHVSALLGHGYTGGGTITERYISADLAGLRLAADAISGEIARILGLVEPGAIVEFPLARGGGR